MRASRIPSISPSVTSVKPMMRRSDVSKSRPVLVIAAPAAKIGNVRFIDILAPVACIPAPRTRKLSPAPRFWVRIFLNASLRPWMSLTASLAPGAETRTVT